MTQNYSLPPGYIVRSAESSDIWEIRRLVMVIISNAFIYSSLGLVFISLIQGAFFLLVDKSLFWYAFISNIFLLGFIIFYLLWQPPQNFWIVKFHHRVVAYAGLIRKPNYTVLSSLYVDSPYRRRRIGSCLVQHLSQYINKPLYLFCAPNLSEFYTRLGFVQAMAYEIPSELRNRGSRDIVFVLL